MDKVCVSFFSPLSHLGQLASLLSTNLFLSFLELLEWFYKIKKDKLKSKLRMYFTTLDVMIKTKSIPQT